MKIRQPSSALVMFFFKLDEVDQIKPGSDAALLMFRT